MLCSHFSFSLITSYDKHSYNYVYEHYMLFIEFQATLYWYEMTTVNHANLTHSILQYAYTKYSFLV